HNVLLDVVERYLALAAAEDRLAAVRLSAQEFAEIARLTENFAKAGQGRQADADRAVAELLLLRDEAAQAEGEIAVASADLAQVLSLVPAIRLHAASPALAPLT